jgi:hypothetical protein
MSLPAEVSGTDVGEHLRGGCSTNQLCPATVAGDPAEEARGTRRRSVAWCRRHWGACAPEESVRGSRRRCRRGACCSRGVHESRRCRELAAPRGSSGDPIVVVRDLVAATVARYLATVADSRDLAAAEEPDVVAVWDDFARKADLSPPPPKVLLSLKPTV